jgi:hypothetical protein
MTTTKEIVDYSDAISGLRKLSILIIKRQNFRSIFSSHYFFVSLSLPTEQYRVSFARTYIYNSYSYELE